MTTPVERPPEPPTDDWEAEQEVDFRRHWDALVSRMWLPLLGLVVGAIIGYAVSLGTSQVYKAESTVYMGQPYTANGNVQLQSSQTSPSTVRTIVNSQRVRAKEQSVCGGKPSVTVAEVIDTTPRAPQTHEVSITVQAAKPKKATCAANLLAREVIRSPAVNGYPSRKVALLVQQAANDRQQISEMSKVLADGSLSSTDELLVQLQLRNAKADLNNAQQLLAQAKQIELPRVVAYGVAEKVTARSRRNSVIVAAIIGLIVGLIAALVWDGVVTRLGARRPAT